MASTFDLVAETTPPFCPSVQLYKWKSRRTGLQAVLIKRQSPSVQGYFAVASEANDNSGCPHTLEHIVFMGSPKYPYKGLLDKLSASQMSGTNAWTDQDQTVYTLSTAGHEGFLNLLPVYLDHIINASVTEAACITEVYHIDGKGEEKGVVFSEMQGHEHTSDSLMSTETQKMLYDPKSGYATNTGGCLSALRELTPETIKQYHRDVYRPSNLSVIVAGDLDPAEMIQVLSDFDRDLVVPESMGNVSSKRPFIDSPLSAAPPLLKETSYRSIVFPDSMESSGEIMVSWLGPHISDLVANTALQVFTTYLWMQDSGKLEAKFVNVPDERALASEIMGSTREFMYTQVSLNLYGVPMLRLQSSCETLVDYLENKVVAELDFAFLKQCIDTVYDGFVLAAETNVQTFVDLAVCDFLYGDESTFTEWLGRADEFSVIREWDESRWTEFINTYIVKPAKACVIGRPSRDEFIRIDEEKKQRIAHTRASRDLEKDAQTLQNAIDENEKPIPEHLLSMFRIPDVEKVRFITSSAGATPKLVANLPGAPLEIDESVQTLIDSALASYPSNLALGFESIDTQFISIKLFISTDAVDDKMKPLLPVILTNSFVSTMILDDGTKLSAEDVAQESQRDLLQAVVGLDGELREYVSISVRAKASKYAQAVEWVQRVMFNIVYDAEQVGIFIARHLKIVPEAKRADSQLLFSSYFEKMFNESSLIRQTGILISEPAVKEFEADLENTAGQLKNMVKQLYQPQNIRGVIIGNIPSIAAMNPDGGLLQPWHRLEAKFAQVQNSAAPLSPVCWPNRFATREGKEPAKDAFVTLCAASDSTNLHIVSQGPLEYGHPDLPALALVNAFLTIGEGPFWKAVRGPGFAYGAMLTTSVELGHVQLQIYSAADAMSAFVACKQIIEDLSNGKLTVSDSELASVLASVVGELAERLAEPASAIEDKFTDTVFKGYPSGYANKVIAEMRNVSLDQFYGALNKYLLPLVDAKSSAVFAVAPPSEERVLKTGLASMGYEVSVKEIEVELDSDEEDSDEEDSDEEESDEDESDEE